MKKALRIGSISILFLALFAASSGSALAVGWTITDLGLGSAYDINDSGQVVGASNGHAVIWNNGTMTDLGTFGGGYSNAQGINNAGQVTGYSNVSRADGTLYMDFVPFLWSNGTMTQLSPGGIGAEAYAINNSGQAVGFSIAANQAWSYGVSLNLNQLKISSAFDINNAGKAVGYGVSNSGSVAFLWDKGAATTLDSLNSAYAINDRGQIIGITANGGAALWNNGTVTDIGPAKRVGGKIFDINNSGQVVGAGLSNNNSPYLWDNGATIDLNSLVGDTGWIFDSANAINDEGQIVGIGTINGQEHAFLITPDSLTPAPVPEPSTIFLLATGMAGFAGVGILNRKRQSKYAHNI